MLSTKFFILLSLLYYVALSLHSNVFFLCFQLIRSKNLILPLSAGDIFYLLLSTVLLLSDYAFTYPEPTNKYDFIQHDLYDYHNIPSLCCTEWDYPESVKSNQDRN